MLVTADVSEQKECCGARYPHQCQRQSLLPASRDNQNREAQIPLRHAERGHSGREHPEGFEIDENPHTQVFLCRIPPKIITDEERRVVEEGMRTYADVQDYKIDVKGKAIVIYTADQDIETLANLFKDMVPHPQSNTQLTTLLRKESQYSPMLRFILDDEKRRTFVTQRYCFRGSIDDWIDIGHGPLTKLVKQYVTHLGQESYFDLY